MVRNGPAGEAGRVGKIFRRLGVADGGLGLADVLADVLAEGKLGKSWSGGEESLAGRGPLLWNSSWEVVERRTNEGRVQSGWRVVRFLRPPRASEFAPSVLTVVTASPDNSQFAITPRDQGITL